MFSSLSKIQQNISKTLETILISKLFDATWNNFQENDSLWMSTTWHEAKVCHFCGVMIYKFDDVISLNELKYKMRFNFKKYSRFLLVELWIGS